MKCHLILFLTLPSTLAFSPSFASRNDGSFLNAKRGRGLDVPPSSGNAKGIAGAGSGGELIIQIKLVDVAYFSFAVIWLVELISISRTWHARNSVVNCFIESQLCDYTWSFKNFTLSDHFHFLIYFTINTKHSTMHHSSIEKVQLDCYVYSLSRWPTKRNKCCKSHWYERGIHNW